jgi:hypothetical protein
VLSLPLPFPMIALVLSALRAGIMGRFANSGVTDAAAIAGTILVLSLNALLVLRRSASRCRVCPAPADRSARTKTASGRLPPVLWKQSSARPLLWSRWAWTRVRHGIRAEDTGKSVAATAFRADDIAF